MIDCGCFYCENCYRDSCKLMVSNSFVNCRQFKFSGANLHFMPTVDEAKFRHQKEARLEQDIHKPDFPGGDLIQSHQCH